MGNTTCIVHFLISRPSSFCSFLLQCLLLLASPWPLLTTLISICLLLPSTDSIHCRAAAAAATASTIQNNIGPPP
jgi:hypothetical protein